jgi:hypothetical protein
VGGIIIKQSLDCLIFLASNATSLSAIRRQLISSTTGSGEVSLKFLFFKRLMAHGGVGAALLATCLQAGAASALTWNWSFNGGPLPLGQGTFTTAGSTAQANTLETITGITGTYTDTSGISSTITGLGTLLGATNTFQWDGSNSSPIIINFDGIAFILDTLGEDNIFYFNPPSNTGYGGINGSIEADSTIPATGFSLIFSSLLSPVLAPSSAPVPSPIPLFGAAAAFGWSRQLRRRIKTPA